MARRVTNRLRDTIAPLILLIGDTLVTFGGLLLGWWLRYKSPLRKYGVISTHAELVDYLRLLALGVAFLIASFAQFGLYDGRLLLRRYLSFNVILRGAGFWLAAYLGVALAVKFDPPISRVFVVTSFVCVVVVLFLWRSLIHAWFLRHWLAQLQRRTVLFGDTAEARTLALELNRYETHPFRLLGVIDAGGAPPSAAEPASTILGPAAELEQILEREHADLLIVTQTELPRGAMERIAEICERVYVEWKVVPAEFDIFLSGLRLETIGRTTVLGVEELAITHFLSRLAKRSLDLLGATVGLIISAPIIAILAALIKRESPEGAVFFHQPRIGAKHLPFTLYKLRSMSPDIAIPDVERGMTVRHDPRLLRIGAFIRRWNLDELPQFWNVFKGEMSLVGPRPERPHLVDQFSASIPHYLPRHLVKPGMTGWAQVNGLRGDTNLTLRIQHDIYYIENWSLWLDVQILLLTFVRWRQAAAF